MTWRMFTVLTAAMWVCTGCADYNAEQQDDWMETPPPTGDFRPIPTTSGGTGANFDHQDSIGRPQTSVEEVLSRMTETGPPEYSARVHSCRKMPYATMGRVLASLGVDLEASGDMDAGAIYRSSRQALGAPNYGARISETTELTAATAGRLFDILVQAAPEIIANVPSLERCRVGGEPGSVFREDGSCSRNGLSCLLGRHVSEAHVELCDDTIARATDRDEGRQIAVASLLAAAFTCE